MVYGYHAHESRMPAARARLTSCMHVWQVVPSTGTCKSINLDLARAAPYRYFTQYEPAHADQNQVLQLHLLPSSPTCSCRPVMASFSGPDGSGDKDQVC